MKNLVLGAATWQIKEHVYKFVRSLRKCYSGDICLLVNSNPKPDTKQFYKENNIITISTNIKGKKIQRKRFNIFLELLERSTYNKIFLTDVRDVIFQKNPFDYNNTDNINFFFEDQIINKCQHNSRWIKKLYGNKIYEDIKFSQISCSGTIYGNKDEIIKYLKLMEHHMKKYRYFSFFNFPHDQGWHNYIVHKEKFLKKKHFFNQDGFVVNLAHAEEKNFVFSDYLKTKNGEIVSVIHQYDRYNFNLSMQNIIKNLIE